MKVVTSIDNKFAKYKNIPAIEQIIIFSNKLSVFNFNKAKYYNSKEYKKKQWQFFFKSIFEGVILNNE